MKWKIIFLLIFSFLFVTKSFTQEIDTITISSPNIVEKSVQETTHKHSVRVATTLSIVLPGAGQIYNKKWWKVPVIYAGLGVASYLIYDFSTQTMRYQKEYIYRLNKDTEKLNPKYTIYTDENILALKNFYRRNMKISIAACAVIYLLNIIDATVDAHLFYFDISDELSFSMQPFLAPNLIYPSWEKGIALTIHF